MSVAYTLEQWWAKPEAKVAASIVVIGLLVAIALGRKGATFAKWVLGLLIVSTLLARWENTFKPWLYEGK